MPMWRPINMKISITCVKYHTICMVTQSMKVVDQPRGHVFDTNLTQQSPLLGILPFTQMSDDDGIRSLAPHATPEQILQATCIKARAVSWLWNGSSSSHLHVLMTVSIFDVTNRHKSDIVRPDIVVGESKLSRNWRQRCHICTSQGFPLRCHEKRDHRLLRLVLVQSRQL